MNNSLQVHESLRTMPKFLSVAEVIKQTGLSRASITRYRKQGIIRSTTVGLRRVLIDSSFIEELRAKMEEKYENK